MIGILKGMVNCFISRRRRVDAIRHCIQLHSNVTGVSLAKKLRYWRHQPDLVASALRKEGFGVAHKKGEHKMLVTFNKVSRIERLTYWIAGNLGEGNPMGVTSTFGVIEEV